MTANNVKGFEENVSIFQILFFSRYTYKKRIGTTYPFFMAQRRGFALLAARPAKQLSIVCFAVFFIGLYIFPWQNARSRSRLPPQILFFFRYTYKKRIGTTYPFFVAQRRGFEPPVGFRPTHDFQSCSLNRSDISAYRTSEWKLIYITLFYKKLQAFSHRFSKFIL